MFPVLQIGSLAIQTSGLILLAGVWIGLSQAEKAARFVGIDPNQVYNLFFAALLSGVVVGRLAFAARFPEVFHGNILSLFTISTSMFDLTSAVFAGAVGALIYGQRARIAFWPALDALTALLACFGVALGLSHLASGAAFGIPTQVPWGLHLWGEVRQPVQVYEILFAVAVLAATLWVLYRTGHPSGAAFLVFAALSAAARIFLEAFRGDSQRIFGSLRTAQVIAWVILAVALLLLGQRLKRESPSTPVDSEEA
jgi:phosphatidylglycerol:prolipoprotein diacylglycerol transferase